MPSAIEKYRQVGDMRERGSGSACLEARWKRGDAVVDDVVDHRGISIGHRDYRIIKEGEETINTKQALTIASHERWKAINALTYYNAISSEREFIRGWNTGFGWLPDRVPGGGDHAGGVVDNRHTCGWCIRVSWSIPNNFRVRNKFIRVLLQYRTNHRTDGPEGGGLMFGMLDGCGERMGSVFVIVDPFWATLIYKVFETELRFKDINY